MRRLVSLLRDMLSLLRAKVGGFLSSAPRTEPKVQLNEGRSDPSARADEDLGKREEHSGAGSVERHTLAGNPSPDVNHGCTVPANPIAAAVAAGSVGPESTAELSIDAPELHSDLPTPSNAAITIAEQASDFQSIVGSESTATSSDNDVTVDLESVSALPSDSTSRQLKEENEAVEKYPRETGEMPPVEPSAPLAESLVIEEADAATSELAASAEVTIEAGVNVAAGLDLAPVPLDDLVPPRAEKQQATAASAPSYKAAPAARMGRSRSPAVPRLRPSHVAEAVVSSSTIEDTSYLWWNRTLLNTLLLAVHDERAYLSITPNVLSAAVDGPSRRSGVEGAAGDFIRAVRSIYHRFVLNGRPALRALRRRGSDGLPQCVAFMAISVLAAYEMRSDEEAAGTAYYTRLANLLDCDLVGGYPRGFDPVEFEALWLFTNQWLGQKGKQLAIPTQETGPRRYIAYPLTHVPLRRVDIEHLPGFFVWAGYSPQSRVAGEKLANDLRSWQRSKNVFSQPGSQALTDNRLDAVIAQVSAELESWDGAVSDLASRRSAIVEVQFDFVLRTPILKYLPRRPSGFPEVFDDGVRVLESSDDGWYDPIRVQHSDGDALSAGFEWRSTANGAEFALQRRSSSVIALAPNSSCSALLSARRLLRGLKCAVLCRNDVQQDVEGYLSEIAQQRLRAASHPQLPSGWSLIREVSPTKYLQAPLGLEQLEVDQGVDFVASGGLKAGRGWAWIAGAPPTLLAAGLGEGDVVKINGRPVDVDTSGELSASEVFETPGEYFIEAGTSRRRVEIVEPAITYAAPQTTITTTHLRTYAVTLPQGDWVVLGPTPDEVCAAQTRLRFGTLISCPFKPVWAVSDETRRGAAVVGVLSVPEPATEGTSRSAGQLRWAEAIYRAHVRRPSFIGLDGVVVDERVLRMWKHYAEVARRIKRNRRIVR
jgi:hypothetical protein